MTFFAIYLLIGAGLAFQAWRTNLRHGRELEIIWIGGLIVALAWPIVLGYAVWHAILRRRFRASHQPSRKP